MPSQPLSPKETAKSTSPANNVEDWPVSSRKEEDYKEKYTPPPHHHAPQPIQSPISFNVDKATVKVTARYSYQKQEDPPKSAAKVQQAQQ